MAKDSNVWSPHMKTAPPPMVRVPFDATKMDSETLMTEAFKLESVSADNRWALSCLYATAFRRGDWTIGLNRARQQDFCAYVNHKEDRDYDPKALFMMIDVYLFYSKFGEEIANIIARKFNGFTKLHIVTPWVTEGNVKAVLDLCLKYPASELRDQCKLQFPIKGRKGIRPFTPPHDNRAVMVRTYLAKPERPLHFIDDTLMVPRHDPLPTGIEAAIWILFAQVMDDTNETADEVFLNACKLLYAGYPHLHQSIRDEWRLWTRRKGINEPFPFEDEADRAAA